MVMVAILLVRILEEDKQSSFSSVSIRCVFLCLCFSVYVRHCVETLIDRLSSCRSTFLPFDSCLCICVFECVWICARQC